jgi:iron complex outermembrane recepter protein
MTVSNQASVEAPSAGASPSGKAGSISRRMLAAFIAAPVMCTGTLAIAADSDSSIEALKSLSVEELLDLEVTSVSKRPEKLLQAPAAIQVITGEDIRRSAAYSIPSALQLASNLDVAQENSYEWIISARGFSSDVGNKLLVLIDGRSVYTPLFSGVFWDRQDYILEDIDRIEVVSGPGGALWGANAVNGVINITTRSAAQTQGLHLEGGGGMSQRGFASARYGGTIAPDVHYRVYGKYSDRDGEALPDGSDANDAWHTGQGGFRIDAYSSGQNRFTLQGDFYRNEDNLPAGDVSTVSGGNLLGRWSRVISDTSETSLQMYYDRTHLTLPVQAVEPAPGLVLAPAGVLEDTLDTVDLDFQHHFQWGKANRLVWGLGYRFTHDVVDNAPGLAFGPASLDQDLFSAFVQDEISLRDDLVLTLGTKVEHTDYTGFEVEPSVRMQWIMTSQQTLWGAVSRAVRTPSRVDRDISQPGPASFIVLLSGGSQFESESLVAYELGYRAQLGERASTSLSLFYNEYDDLRSTSLSPPDAFGLPFPLFFANNLEGETHGFELSGVYQLRDRWQLQGGYRLLQEDIRVKPGRFDFNNALNETSDPQQQLSLRSRMEVGQGVEFDTGLRWVDTRTVNNSGVPAKVPDYLEMDVRLGWRPTESLEVSLLGQNLLHDHHPEYGVPGPGRIEIERSVYGRVVWRY